MVGKVGEHPILADHPDAFELAHRLAVVLKIKIDVVTLDRRLKHAIECNRFALTLRVFL